MNEGTTLKVGVNILDKEYLISCQDNSDKESLYRSVEYLNQQLLDMKNNSSIIGTERIVVMTALNITNELLAYKEESQDLSSRLDNTLQRLHTKVNAALHKSRHIRMLDAGNPISQKN